MPHILGWFLSQVDLALKRRAIDVTRRERDGKGRGEVGAEGARVGRHRTQPPSLLLCGAELAWGTHPGTLLISSFLICKIGPGNLYLIGLLWGSEELTCSSVISWPSLSTSGLRWSDVSWPMQEVGRRWFPPDQNASTNWHRPMSFIKNKKVMRVGSVRAVPIITSPSTTCIPVHFPKWSKQGGIPASSLRTTRTYAQPGFSHSSGFAVSVTPWAGRDVAESGCSQQWSAVWWCCCQCHWSLCLGHRPLTARPFGPGHSRMQATLSGWPSPCISRSLYSNNQLAIQLAGGTGTAASGAPWVGHPGVGDPRAQTTGKQEEGLFFLFPETVLIWVPQEVG